MALIKCPECGEQISDKAPACIYCGCPASEFLINNNLSEEVIQATNICIFRNKEQDVSCISQYYIPLSEEDKTHFKQFLELEYGISNFRPVISDEKYLQFYNELKKWSEFYFLSTYVTAKLVLECIKIIFKHSNLMFYQDIMTDRNSQLHNQIHSKMLFVVHVVVLHQ